MDDWTLLERFREDRSEPAFAELVRRHAGLVYGVCRRRLRDAHLAEDVTQAVFALLARRGPRLRAPTLAPWLIRTAHYACANAHRARTIRERHEHLAAEQRIPHQVTHMSNDATSHARQDDVELLLDEAMRSAVSESERQLLMLRYHHDHDLNAVGAALDVAPNTAAKRLSRALERLRKFMSDRGVTLSGVAVAEVITKVSHESAPAGLVAKVMTVATGTAAAPLVVQHIYHGVTLMIRMMKIKLVAATMGAVILGGSGVVALNQLLAQSAAKTAQAPATAPAAAQQPRKLIAKSPKEAMTLFAKASREVDIEGMKSLVHIEDPREEQLLLSACDFAGANAAFLAAVKEKFGAEAEQQLRKGMRTNPFEEFLNSIENDLDELTETIDGDRAVLREGDEPDPVKLICHEGSWKISATGTTETWSDQQHEQALAGIQRGTEVFAELAREIGEGKFASFQDLAQTLQQMFGQGR
jgi:RNA polymerase sigma factor (sigma-70 family)